MKYFVIGEDWNGNRVEITELDEMRQLGVIAIANVNPDVGWWIECGANFYVKVGDHYWGCDLAGLLIYIQQYPHQHILIGKMVSNDVFAEVLQYLKDTAKLPPKVGYLANEEKPVVFHQVDMKAG